MASISLAPFRSAFLLTFTCCVFVLLLLLLNRECQQRCRYCRRRRCWFFLLLSLSWLLGFLLHSFILLLLLLFSSFRFGSFCLPNTVGCCYRWPEFLPSFTLIRFYGGSGSSSRGKQRHIKKNKKRDWNELAQLTTCWSISVASSWLACLGPPTAWLFSRTFFCQKMFDLLFYLLLLLIVSIISSSSAAVIIRMRL